LTDPQERAFYDKHRENIIRGSSAEERRDTGINLYAFFQKCYFGYGDDEDVSFLRAFLINIFRAFSMFIANYLTRLRLKSFHTLKTKKIKIFRLLAILLAIMSLQLPLFTIAGLLFLHNARLLGLTSTIFEMLTTDTLLNAWKRKIRSFVMLAKKSATKRFETWSNM
jgi:hypothetical protein